jgi:hypothetical protein
MNLAAWAECNGVARVAAYHRFRAGLLPIPAQTKPRSPRMAGNWLWWIRLRLMTTWCGL